MLKGENVTPEIGQQLKQSAKHFGLFLQKLNIIRDINEDTQNNRSFWPEELIAQSPDPIERLNILCNDALKNDIPQAITYYENIPEGNTSFDYFIRFILWSGLKYLQLLTNNQGLFSSKKVKLPKLFVKYLYQHVSELDRKTFLSNCKSNHEEMLENFPGVTV